ncbi:uncharacterized protein LOC6571233 [Drosophila grimshawi]|uniref:GH11768 n=1 Tax=Drosophila grimshawi TaxID=7222 RepID=B4JJL2_DROGR|nr:uncharacterized protein LOC6571232 [Drosophila grimshawi]XP_001997437.2 uncharacterized protein LOC6571233 [Drosophila grimshawi]EDV99764.1 GH12508 [Drosophila grimshawi]EDW04388.1 GH11768 [Drosophila grimshawi]
MGKDKKHKKSKRSKQEFTDESKWETDKPEQNFDWVGWFPRVLSEPLAQEMFMANLGMTKTSYVIDGQSSGSSSSSTTTRVTRQMRMNKKTERIITIHPVIGEVQAHMVEVEAHIYDQIQLAKNVETERILREEQSDAFPKFPFDLPLESQLRCNDCRKREGLKYVCDRCVQPFHQECHLDGGLSYLHNVCPICVRQLNAQRDAIENAK